MSLIRCPDCDKILATPDDDERFPPGDGDHLCWRKWCADICDNEPMDWRRRALDAETRLYKITGFVNQLVIGSEELIEILREKA